MKRNIPLVKYITNLTEFRISTFHDYLICMILVISHHLQHSKYYYKDKNFGDLLLTIFHVDFNFLTQKRYLLLRSEDQINIKIHY